MTLTHCFIHSGLQLNSEEKTMLTNLQVVVMVEVAREPTDGEENEALTNRTTQAAEKDIPCCLGLQNWTDSTTYIPCYIWYPKDSFPTNIPSSQFWGNWDKGCKLCVLGCVQEYLNIIKWVLMHCGSLHIFMKNYTCALFPKQFQNIDYITSIGIIRGSYNYPSIRTSSSRDSNRFLTWSRRFPIRQ